MQKHESNTASTHSTTADQHKSGGHQNQTNKSHHAATQDSRLKEFFLDELKDIYWAEQKLVKTLPKLEKAATTKELQSAFSSHLKETEGHVERLEQAFQMLGEKPVAEKCEAMQGITDEGDTIIGETKTGTATRDVGLVMAGQKAEHYEIATYGALIQLAHVLGYDDIAKLFEQTLQEEKNADQKLTSIAEEKINYAAASEAL